MTKLLISETSHQVQPSLAAEIGLNEAMFLQQLHFRIHNNECYYHEERLWWIHSCTKWSVVFPYWSESTIKRIIQSLKKQNLITVKQLSAEVLKNKSDQSNWYAINHETVNEIGDELDKKRQAAIKKKTVAANGKPVKFKGEDLVTETAETPREASDSALGQNDPPPQVNVNHPPGQCGTISNKTYIRDLKSTTTTDSDKFKKFAIAMVTIIENMMNEDGWVPEDTPVPRASWLELKTHGIYQRILDRGQIPDPADCAVLVLGDWVKITGGREE